jgi:hypothetical protein
MPRKREPRTAEQITADLSELQQAYCTTFMGAAGQIVQEDLADFCRANESTFDADPRMHAVLEGRREVWLRIQNTINLTVAQQFALYARLVPQREPNAV